MVSDRMKKRFINPDKIPKSKGFTQIVKVENPTELIIISGQTSGDEKGNLVGKGDIKAQTHQVFKNLGTALQAVGAGFSDIVSLNIYMKNISDLNIVREIRSQYLNKQNPPAITSVGVTGLAREELLIEIEALAAL